ncbi:MAG: type II toxin-antitoxin system HicB family antitoxin [Nocardioidaceae bacterium]
MPGCVAIGDTQEERIRSMREAVALHLAGMRADGAPVPHPSTVAATTLTTAA